MSQADALIAAISKALAAAPEAEKGLVADAIEDYAERFPTTWKKLNTGAPFLKKLLDAIGEATDARPE